MQGQNLTLKPFFVCCIEIKQIVGAAGISFPLRAADFQFLPAALQQDTQYVTATCSAAGRNARSSYRLHSLFTKLCWGDAITSAIKIRW